MKKIAAIFVAAFMTLGLAGCGSGGIDLEEYKGTINRVIDEAEKICQFEPTVHTVAAMITAYNLAAGAAAGSVAALTRIICSQVENLPRAASGDALPKSYGSIEINGKTVEIEGKFVPKK